MTKGIFLAIVLFFSVLFALSFVDDLHEGNGGALNVRELPQNKTYTVVWRSEGGSFYVAKEYEHKFVYISSDLVLPTLFTVLNKRIMAVEEKNGQSIIIPIDNLSTSEIEKMVRPEIERK